MIERLYPCPISLKTPFCGCIREGPHTVSELPLLHYLDPPSLPGILFAPGRARVVMFLAQRHQIALRVLQPGMLRQLLDMVNVPRHRHMAD